MKHERFSAPARASVELLDAPALRHLDADEWDALASNALVENPFYSRQYLLAGLDTVDRHSGLQAMVVRNQRGELIGLFPYRRRRLPFATGDAARNIYQPNGTPLVRRDHAPLAISAWLSATAPRFWHVGHVPIDARLLEHVDTALQALGMRRYVVNAYERPTLTRMPGGIDQHLDEVVAKNRLKDIRRNLRRLGEQGKVRFEQAYESDLVARRFEQFLALEDSGWKGETGTSFLAREESAAFARAAFGARTTRDLVSIDSLLLDEVPIAMSVNLRSRHVAFAAKCAYDERYRRFSPGLLLEFMVIKAFYEDSRAQAMDACTTTEGHVISGFWNASQPMGTLIIGPDDWRTRTVAALVTRAHAGRERTKSALRLLPLRRWAEQAHAWSKNKGRLVPWTAALSAALTMAALYAE